MRLRSIKLEQLGWAVLISLLSACGGGGSDQSNAPEKALQPVEPTAVPSPASLTQSELDFLLQQRSTQLRSVTVKPVNDPLVQLGMRLFFSKSLGGDQDVACASCHHPALGGGDGQSLSVGVGVANPDLLGPGRVSSKSKPTPRNANTVFNMALWDSGLFWDSRVESLDKTPGANGAGPTGNDASIHTPDVPFAEVDPLAGPNLPSAQARSPVVGVDEMKGADFEAAGTKDQVRDHLADRIGDKNIGIGELNPNQWLPLFQAAFNTNTGNNQADAASLITFANIAFALGEYQRSMDFTHNPWQQFLQSNGAVNNLSINELQGALLFFKPVSEQGAGCVSCHNGPLLSDEQHHVVGYPSIGAGVENDGDDFGRERATGLIADRYAFRTASLLNIALTKPYGHSGAYSTLEQVVSHYRSPELTVAAFFDKGGLCLLEQFKGGNCKTAFPNNRANTQLALQKLKEQQNAGTSLLVSPQLTDEQAAQLVAFLQALTDPCLLDRACYGQWIPDANTSPDNNQLQGVNLLGQSL